MLENILSEEYNEDTVKEIIEGYCKRITSFRINSLHPASNPLKELDAHNIKYEQISWYNNAYIVLNNEEKIRGENEWVNGNNKLLFANKKATPYGVAVC